MEYAGAPLVCAAALPVVWPWLTLAACLVFQASMRRARIGNHHVMRCAIYSMDFALWLGLVVAALAAGTVATMPRSTGYYGARTASEWHAALLNITLAWSAAALLVGGWRLAQAYRLYLRFDRPILTVVAIQTIMLLVAINAYFIAFRPTIMWLFRWNP
jgi:hypothetical protein